LIYYYHIDNKHRGKRLFKHDTWNNTVLQVVVRMGEKKSGRPNMLGVYRIHEVTLKSNYLWTVKDENGVKKYGLDVRYTTKKLFLYYLKLVISNLLKDSDNG